MQTLLVISVLVVDLASQRHVIWMFSSKLLSCRHSMSR